LGILQRTFYTTFRTTFVLDTIGYQWLILGIYPIYNIELMDMIGQIWIRKWRMG